MKKYLVFSFLATILFTACDDTRKAMHDEYLEFVMHTDSLETVHEAMVVSHEAVKADTRTLAKNLKMLRPQTLSQWPMYRNIKCN